MLFVEGDAVDGVVAVVCAGAEVAAYSDLGGEADNGDADLVGGQCSYGLVDVAWVGGEEGAEDYEDFAGAVGWCVANLNYLLDFVFFFFFFFCLFEV